MWRKVLVLITVFALFGAACSGSTDGDDGAVEVGTESDDSSSAVASAANDDDNADDDAGDAAADSAAMSDDAGGTSSDADAGSSSQASDDGAASDDDAGSESDSATSGTVSEAGSDNEYESPLFDLIGFDPTSFEDIDWEQQERERQLDVQECMRDQGFEYTPQDFGGFESFGPPGDPDIEWGTREFAETYGYGNSTFFEEQFDYEDDFISEEWVDPNQDYLDSLSEAERMAWERALYGEEPEFFDAVDPETGEPINPETGEPYTQAEEEEFWMNFEPTGCQNVGWDTPPEEYALVDAFFTEFEDVFIEMEERMESDPRTANLEDEWVRCMSDRSFTFSGQDDIWMEIERRMEPIYQEVFAFDPFSFDEGDGTGFIVDESEGESSGGFTVSEGSVDMSAEPPPMTDEEAEEFFRDYQPPTPEITAETRAKLEEIQAWEIAVAVADFDCSEGNEAIYNEVRIEIEEQFIAENQAAITAFLEENQQN